ncbi:alpha/beta fold hydrolase [Spongorhabdus nitratireducens]
MKITTEDLTVTLPQGPVYTRQWIPANLTIDIPLILLHDSLGSVGLWRDFPQQLATSLGCRVIAYDRLGFGQSGARQQLPSLNFISEEATEYFPAIKQQLGIQQYALLGHSVGGCMAINIAAHDNDCQAVITLAAQAFVEPLTTKGIAEGSQLFQQPRQMARLEKWHGNKAAWVLNAWTGVWLSPEFADWSLQPVIGKVQCPVLAIHGELDEYGSRAFPVFIAGNSSGKGEMLLLPDCGHMPHREQTDKVVAAISVLLQKEMHLTTSLVSS